MINGGNEFLRELVGCYLQSCKRHQETELFGLYFGRKDSVKNIYCLHIQCQMEMHLRNTGEHIITINGDTSTEAFYSSVLSLFQYPIKRIKLESYQNLVLDIGPYTMYIKTYVDNEESWRLFDKATGKPYLIASHSKLKLIAE